MKIYIWASCILLALCIAAYAAVTVQSKVIPAQRQFRPALTLPELNLPATVPVTPCDKRYALEMQQTLQELKSYFPRNFSNIDLMAQAEDYMIKIKQYQDLEYAIRAYELNVFNTAIVSKLRTPLEQYARCKNAIRTGTYMRPIPH